MTDRLGLHERLVRGLPDAIKEIESSVAALLERENAPVASQKAPGCEVVLAHEVVLVLWSNSQGVKLAPGFCSLLVCYWPLVDGYIEDEWRNRRVMRLEMFFSI